MLNTINSDLIRGNINTIILKALFDGDRYGYDIVKEIEQKSSGQYKLKQPTLYSCLKRLEVQGFIRSYWGAKSSGGRRKYYTLTDMGRELFIKNQTEWEYSRTVIDKLISDREYDLSKAEIPADEDYESFSDETSENINETEIHDENSESRTDRSTEDNSRSAEETAATENEEAGSEKYPDTSSILTRLFETQSTDDSYTDKLATEQYAAKERINFDDYFKDFTEEIAETEDDNLSDEQVDEISESESTPNEYPDGLRYFPEREYNENNAENEALQTESDSTEQPAPQDAATANNFISYRAKLEEYDDDRRLLEREYRNVLGTLISGTTEQPDEADRIPQPAYIPLSNEMAENIARIDAENGISEEDAAAAAARITQTNPKSALDQGLTTISDAALRSTGDTVRTRIHDDKAAANYNTQYHYFSNKLMLVQYAILFGIMMLETAFTFLLVKVGLKINNKYDVYTYIFSIIIALAFPITAAILNFTDSQKTKRFDYDFKSSMIFRIWITVCCLIIVYCLNIFLGMPMSFSKDYLSSLILPILLSFCFPVSAIIFKLLHDTGKFNQTY